MNKFLVLLFLIFSFPCYSADHPLIGLWEGIDHTMTKPSYYRFEVDSNLSGKIIFRHPLYQEPDRTEMSFDQSSVIDRNGYYEIEAKSDGRKFRLLLVIDSWKNKIDIWLINKPENEKIALNLHFELHKSNGFELKDVVTP